MRWNNAACINPIRPIRPISPMHFQNGTDRSDGTDGNSPNAEPAATLSPPHDGPVNNIAGILNSDIQSSVSVAYK